MRAFLFPGQGSQRKGMGADLFAQYPEYVKKADAILGYSIEELCIADPEGRINFTAYTQPAIFVVSVFNYLEALKTEARPDMTAGHSIGEYAALFAAEVFDFETGLRIVQKRAEFMSEAEGGALAAVIGLTKDEVKARIEACGLSGIEIANINSPTQIVVGSKAETIQEFAKFSDGKPGRVIPLRVSGAFHTTYMREAQLAFRGFLDNITFHTPSLPVMSNYTAQPHNRDDMTVNLASHLSNPVRWVECVENMLLSGVETFTEIGSKILTPMVNDIREHLTKQPPSVSEAEALNTPQDYEFCTHFGFKTPMVVGATGYGAAGAELVSSLARDGVLSFLDTYRQPVTAIENALQTLSADQSITGKYGVSLIFNNDVDFEEDAIELCLRYAVRFIELRGYHEPTEALIRYRTEGGVDADGRPHNRIMLRVTDSDMAMPFLACYPTYGVPMVDAVCADTRSWRSAKMDDTSFQQFLKLYSQLGDKVFVGLSGHAATQQPVQAALAKGADFALVGSVFLLADEANLEFSIKNVLSNATEQQFKEVFDWAYPALGTTSFSHVLNERVSEQVTALQQVYLRDDLNAAMLREFSQHYTSEDGSLRSLFSDRFIDACEGMNKFEIRERVRARVQSSVFPHILHCESAFPDFAKWLNAQGESFPVGAAKLAGLIYSNNYVN